MKIIGIILLTLLTNEIYSQVTLGTYSINQKYYGYSLKLRADKTFESSEIRTDHLFVLYYSTGTWTAKAGTLTIYITKLGVGKKEELPDSLMVDVNYTEAFLIKKDKLKQVTKNGQPVKKIKLKKLTI